MQTSVDDVHLHAHKTGHSRLDLVIALSAIAISITSLFVAIAHGRTEERLVAASSWPFLTFDTEKNGLDADGWTIFFRLKNGGVGPARVKWFRMSLDGQPIRTRAELMSRCCGVPDGSVEGQVRLGLISQNRPIGVLPAREAVEMLTWKTRPGTQAIVAKLDAARRRLRTEACYCSVLDECWTSDLTPTADPSPVNTCEPRADAYTD